MSAEKTIFVSLALALVLAMAAGQFRVAYRAVKHGKVGIGRFTYTRAVSPLGFWVMAALEWLGFGVVFVYLLAFVTRLLFP